MPHVYVTAVLCAFSLFNIAPYADDATGETNGGSEHGELDSSSDKSGETPGESGSSAPRGIPLPEVEGLATGPKSEILNYIAQGHLANRTGIRNWSGKVIVKDKISRGGAPAYRTTFRVNFVVDATQDAFRWDRETLEAFEYKDGQEIAFDNGLGPESGMRKASDFYRLKPFADNSGRHHISVGPTSGMKLGPASVDFSPMYYFTDYGQELDDRFQYFYEQSKYTAWHWTTTREGSLVTVSLNATNLVNTYVVDIDQGCNLVELVNFNFTDPERKILEVGTRQQWEWIKVGDVWVPDFVRFSNDNRKKDTLLERTIEWSDHVVNGEIAPDEFTVAKMGARDGDYLVDVRSATRLVLGKKSPETTTPAPRSSRFYIILVNVLVLLVLVAIYLVRLVRRRSNPTI